MGTIISHPNELGCERELQCINRLTVSQETGSGRGWETIYWAVMPFSTLCPQLLGHVTWWALHKYLMNEWIHLLQPLALHMRNPMSPSYIIGSQPEFLNIMEVLRIFNKDFSQSVLLTNVRTKTSSHEEFWALKFSGKGGDSHPLTLHKIHMKCGHLKCVRGKEKPSWIWMKGKRFLPGKAEVCRYR